MFKSIRYFLIIMVMIQGGHSFSQTSERLGLLPPAVKWKELKHDSLRIIYPDGQEGHARRIASLMLKLAGVDPIVRHGRFKPISIILQPQTNISNGYVGLAPYASELYLEPHENPFTLGSLPWSDLLALHEYRHVLQENAANNGISHIFKTIFGDLVFSGLYALSVPNWYREGDAVYMETKWSLQGRGRLSSFTLPFYEKALEGDPWNYYTVRNGSYREYTPDYYALGYMMIQYGNQFFGESTWDSLEHLAPRYKHLLRPFSGLLKEKYGKKTKGLYLDAMGCYHDDCTVTRVKDVIYPAVPLQAKDLENDFFEITYPVVDGDGSIYAAVTTFDRTTAIYQFNSGGERKKIASTGLQKDTYFSHNNGRLVWTELRFDPRWIRKDKSVIVLFDIHDKSRRSFEPDKGYFTPALNTKGDRIVALHEDQNGQYHLRILDARAGALITELPNPENLYLGYPCFNENEDSIIATARNAQGQMCLIEQDIGSGHFRYITHYSFAVLGRPMINGPWIFVTGGLDQLDQVFAVDRSQGIFYQVSEGNDAHYDPAWDPVQDNLICSEFRLNGKKLVRLPGEAHQWKLINLDNGIKKVAGFTGRNLLSEPVDGHEFQIKKYSSWAHAINPHSWVITANDPLWSVEARSNNVLNTISMAAGYAVNRDTRAKGPYLTATFGMWYPQFFIGISRILQEEEHINGSNYKALNNRLTAGVALPLIFTPGVFSQSLYTSLSYSRGLTEKRLPEGYQNIHFNYGTILLALVNSRKRAYRQPLPTWGQRLEASYSHELNGVRLSQFYGDVDLAFPALRPSHNLVVQGEFLIRDISDESISLPDQYFGSRGFPAVEGQTQYHIGLTYGFPLWYPDLGIGNIFYTRRIRLQPFFDLSYTNNPLAPDPYLKSVGAELIFDFHFPPISFGVRFARLLSGFTGSQNQFEFFIPSQRF